MKFFRWMAVSFSIYSRIPMPRFEWTEEDYGHSLVFFPMIGAVIGVLSVAVYAGSVRIGLPDIAVCTVFTLIPVLVTGGFHLDGYMDTMDARSSYRDREEKLRILSDPHIGSFAVISVIAALLAYIGAAGVIVHPRDMRAVISLGLLYVSARSVSGLLAMLLPGAKDKGMLRAETAGNRRGILISQWIWLIASLAGIACTGYMYAVGVAAALILFAVYYRHMVISQFGGVTGDTAGYLLTMSEVTGCIAIAAVSLIVL